MKLSRNLAVSFFGTDENEYNNTYFWLNPVTENRLPHFAIGAGLGAVLLAYPLFFFPLTIYLGNSDEFSVSFFSIVQIYMPLAVVISGLLGLVAMLLGGWREKFFSFLSVLSLLFWLQGSLLVWHYGLLDGRAIDWSVNVWQGWFDGALWIGLLLLASLLAKRYVFSKIALALFSVQLCLAVFNLFHYSDELRKESVSDNLSEIKNNIYSFSTTKNVVQILADGFQSDIFEEVISDGERGQRIAASMEGFTFFRDHLGAFPFTHMSMPAILGGEIYKNQTTIDEHIRKSIGGKTSISVAHQAGYEIDIVNPGGHLRTMYEKSPSTNFYTVPPMQHLSGRGIETFESAKLLDLSLFRIAPHFLKQYVYNDQLWLVQSFMTGRDYMGLQFFQHIAFLNDLSTNMTVTRKTPVYKFLHLTLSHNPMVSDEACGYAGQVLLTVRPTVKFQARCALEEMVKLIESMKRHGIYDDSLILFMADHGAWVVPAGLRGPIAEDKKSMEVMDPQLAALAMPLLAIKRPGDSGPIKISDAQSWVPDTAKTIAEILELDAAFVGRNVFTISETERRQRRFYFYEYQRNDWVGEFLTPITEAVVDGAVKDRASWQVTETYLPNGVVERDNPVELPTFKAMFQ